ncbi:MAG: HAD-IIIA family hydrolase [Bacteroidales bacterium]|jgi:histidinol-phosphate phosphatase family protein|nr:HAD-IIIA family hydrolase [Bacteroidales bacterium]
MTLFLDRDGVINKRIIDGYVCEWKEFVFEEGVLEALKILSKHFSPIIVVSNQQGIGKGLMSEEDFRHISEKMIEEVKFNGGMIDCVLHCPALSKDNSFNRKPQVGMGLRAKKMYSDNVRFKESIMVGDSFPDMLFGKRLKMKTVFISDSYYLPRKYPKIIDLRFDSLIKFAKYIENEKGI